MYIFVKSSTGRTIHLRVEPSDTLSTVKAKIQEQYRLVFDGVELEDNLTLADYDIQHMSTLDLEEKMQIYVLETLLGTAITLEVDSLLDTIGNVKDKIESTEGFPKRQQCLLFNNKQLDDNSTLADNYICKEAILLLVLHSSPRSTMKIFVERPTGKTLTLKVSSTDIIDYVKTKIYQKNGYRPKQQRLIWAGMALEDRQTLADYDIENEETLIRVVVERDAVHGYSTTSSIYLCISGVFWNVNNVAVRPVSFFSTSSGVFSAKHPS